MTKKVFIARIPSYYKEKFFKYDVKEIKSEHMISESVEFWDKEITTVFKPTEWNKLIEKPTKDNWWIYRYERINYE
ncbi:hypothetical protein LCGC14_2520330 [marine sediment metagenome]|uniref:Uncharacterized protein n=1 Tax=marine sediment metagenome TaxID=412755 RepID=A0A0F9DPV5_9ZZZZ